MQLWRFIKFLSSVTLLALIYIYLQMNIFSLGYQGKESEQHIASLKEQNGRVSNNIFELKSASYLGPRMLKDNPELKFYDDESIVKLVTARKSSSLKNTVSNQQRKTNSLSKLFNWRFPSVAHAKEQKSRKPWEKHSD